MGAGFPAPVQTGPGAHPASCTMGTESFPGVNGRGVVLTTHPHLAPRLKKDSLSGLRGGLQGELCYQPTFLPADWRPHHTPSTVPPCARFGIAVSATLLAQPRRPNWTRAHHDV